MLLLSTATALAGGYDPGLDQQIFLGDFELDALEEITVPVPIEENNNPVVGFSVDLFFQDLGEGTFSYASDLRMLIDTPASGGLSIGGYDNEAFSDLLWDFQGSGSDLSGDYHSGPHLFWEPKGIPKGGEWLFTLINDWSGSQDGVQWNSVVVTLHKVPEPATVLLLALGGLAALRRR